MVPEPFSFHVDSGHSSKLGHDEAFCICAVPQARLQGCTLGECRPCSIDFSLSCIEGHGSRCGASVHARAQQGERQLGGD